MDRTPGERPPESRQLDRPPSARFEADAAAAASEGPQAPSRSASDATAIGLRGGSLPRAIAFAAPAAFIALLVYVAFGGPLGFSAGLVVVAIFAGRIIGLSAKAGGGTSLSSDRSVVVALGITLAWFVLAQVATWLFARSEGGVLPLIDYLSQTFGPIVPLSLIASVLAAWWSAR